MHRKPPTQKQVRPDRLGGAYLRLETDEGAGETASPISKPTAATSGEIDVRPPSDSRLRKSVHTPCPPMDLPAQTHFLLTGPTGSTNSPRDTTPAASVAPLHITIARRRAISLSLATAPTLSPAAMHQTRLGPSLCNLVNPPRRHLFARTLGRQSHPLEPPPRDPAAKIMLLPTLIGSSTKPA